MMLLHVMSCTSIFVMLLYVQSYRVFGCWFSSF
jgi:hypothetical protein